MNEEEIAAESAIRTACLAQSALILAARYAVGQKAGRVAPDLRVVSS